MSVDNPRNYAPWPDGESDIPRAYEALRNQVSQDMQALYDASAGASVYDIAGGTLGKPGASAVVARFEAVRAFSLPSALDGSRATAGTLASADTAFTVKKNTVIIGTMTFHSNGTVTFAAASATSFAPGDVLSVVAPSSQDGALADIAFTLAGSLT